MVASNFHKRRLEPFYVLLKVGDIMTLQESTRKIWEDKKSSQKLFEKISVLGVDTKQINYLTISQFL